jgi:hypothetical protein
MGVWEKFRRTAADLYATASERTVQGVNLGVLKMDLVTLRREFSRELASLGERTYALLRREEGDRIPSDTRILHHMGRLSELEARLTRKEAEVREAMGPGAGAKE